MKTKKLLVTALLATAIAALMGGLVVETKGQSMSPHDLFFHGLPTGRVASQSELGSLERANEWLNSPPCRRRLDWLTSAELLDW